MLCFPANAEFASFPSQLECRSGSCLAGLSWAWLSTFHLPLGSCSLSAVTDLNNSLSQRSLKTWHSGANQLPRHNTLRGGGESHGECQRGWDKERNPGEERWGEKRGAVQQSLKNWSAQKKSTLFSFFTHFLLLLLFHISAPNSVTRLLSVSYQDLVPVVLLPCTSPSSMQ